MVTLRIVVNEYGKPAGMWVTPSVHKLQPYATADAALKELLEALIER